MDPTAARAAIVPTLVAAKPPARFKKARATPSRRPAFAGEGIQCLCRVPLLHPLMHRLTDRLDCGFKRSWQQWSAACTHL